MQESKPMEASKNRPQGQRRSSLEYFLEKNLIPDGLLRLGARWITRSRLAKTTKMSVGDHQAYMNDFIDARSQGPIAINTQEANDQHYQLPSSFFDLILGQRKKYSCAYWQDGDTLAEAETAMLDLVCQRANLKDGQDILELGCGWGSFCLYAAERYPQTKITAVSNAQEQRLYIEKRAQERGLSNLKVITCDINDLALEADFDRIVSVEMFEHMRNYQALFAKVSKLLRPQGQCFVHVFCHKSTPYTYEQTSSRDWMAKYFFTGGTMPSRDLFLYINDHLRVDKQWAVNGRHYQKTLEAWLKRMDEQKEAVLPILDKIEGRDKRIKWWSYWRTFFIASSEFFAIKQGNEYFVAHYLFKSRVENR